MEKKKIMLIAALSTALLGCENSEITSLSDYDTASKDGITIIAGSEIENISPMLIKASNELKLPIYVKYSGTIDAVDDVRTNIGKYDIAWFGNSKYFYDNKDIASRIKLSEKIMISPIIVGVKEESFNRNSLDKNQNYSWSDINKWVINKKMTYAMTDPSTSNTGYTALLGVVYSNANKGENITINDVDQDTLKAFFKGQQAIAKSSKWIMDKFNNSNIDFTINYESSILSNPNSLIPVYPNEGIVTADYQMLKLNNTKIDKYKQLVEWFKKKENQLELVNTYKYRSINSEVMNSQTVFDNNKLLIEMPFNPKEDLAETILENYYNNYKKPAKFVFILDTSGSMSQEGREQQLKKAFEDIINKDISKHAAVRKNEIITVLPFNDVVGIPQKFNYENKKDMNDFVQQLKMTGGTAMFDSVVEAIKYLKNDQIQGDNADKYNYSIVVFTDGASNQGMDDSQFTNWYNESVQNKNIPIFAIQFGSADSKQLQVLANLSGGKVFNSNESNLYSTLKEIRTYQ